MAENKITPAGKEDNLQCKAFNLCFEQLVDILQSSFESVADKALGKELLHSDTHRRVTTGASGQSRAHKTRDLLQTIRNSIKLRATHFDTFIIILSEDHSNDDLIDLLRETLAKLEKERELVEEEGLDSRVVVCTTPPKGIHGLSTIAGQDREKTSPERLSSERELISFNHSASLQSQTDSTVQDLESNLYPPGTEESGTATAGQETSFAYLQPQSQFLSKLNTTEQAVRELRSEGGNIVEENASLHISLADARKQLTQTKRDLQENEELLAQAQKSNNLEDIGKLTDLVKKIDAKISQLDEKVSRLQECSERTQVVSYRQRSVIVQGYMSETHNVNKPRDEACATCLPFLNCLKELVRDGNPCVLIVCIVCTGSVLLVLALCLCLILAHALLPHIC